MKFSIVQNKFILSDEIDKIHFSYTNIKDIKDMLPTTPSNLQLFINQNILKTKEERNNFDKMISRAGGIQKAMYELQNMIMKIKLPAPPKIQSKKVDEMPTTKVYKKNNDEIPTAEVVPPFEPPARTKSKSIDVVLSGDEYWITDGNLIVSLNDKSFKELRQAVSSGTGNLFRLINDTYLQTKEDRDTLQKIIKSTGGMKKAMDDLAKKIQQAKLK